MYSPVDWPSPDLVSRQAAATPDRTAMLAVDEATAWTYRDLDEGPVAALAGGLAGMGLAPGDHLGVVAEPGVRLAQLVHAAARAGVRLVPLPPDAPAAVVDERGDVADIDGLVTSDAPSDGSRPTFEGPTRALVELANGDATHDPHRWHRDEVQWLVFTSGTTGAPRPVELTAGNLAASATASALRLGVVSEDRWLVCLPMHHVGGLAPLVRSALYGTAAVVQSGFDATATAEAVASLEVTGVSLVPTMLGRLLDAGWTPPPSLRFVLLGGAPVPPSLVERADAAGVPVCPTYGMTETASQVATARPGEAVAHPGTVGRPLAGVELEIRAEGGETVAAGDAGELVVAGPTLSPGYYDDAAADGFDGRWFHTRDRGYRDDAGRLRVLGRLDDAIVTGGETVRPGTVEACLCEHPAVEDAAVVGLDDETWGQVVGALVVSHRAGEVDAAALRDHCRERLEPPAVPKVLAAAAELPRTASGTVDRDGVRERLRAVGEADGR